jgi:hypothetical protein
MLKRSTVIAIDLFLVLFNLGVASFHALCIYGGDLRRAALVGMIGSACMGIVMLLVTRWYLRECARQDRELASLLMSLVHQHARMEAVHEG